MTTDDGTVAWVAVGSNGDITWEGLDSPATTFDYETALTVTDSNDGTLVNGHVVASREGLAIEDGFGRPEGSGDTGTRGTLSWDVPNPGNSDGDNPTWLIARNDDLQNNPDETTGDDYNTPPGAASYTHPDAINTGALTVDPDGGSETYTFEKSMTVTIHSEDGQSVTAETTGAFDLMVENLEAGTGVTHDGDADAGGDPDKQA